MMTRLMIAMALAFMAMSCEKPSEDDCRKAIANMRRLLGTDKATDANDMEAAVRSCRGNSHKKTVTCAIAAQSVDELKACGLLKTEKK